MAGRFSFSVPGRRNAGDPWFRIGTLDVSTTILVILLCVGGMVLWAFGERQTLWNDLVLVPDEVRRGEVWRLFTWPIANVPDIWPVITLAIFWYFGREIEGMLGRVRFACSCCCCSPWCRPSSGSLLDITEAGLAPIELAVFLIFIAEYPYVRFFFGIPAWAIGAVIVAIQLLQYLGLGEEERIILLFVTIATPPCSARSMGLAQSLPWIPKIPFPATGGGGRAAGARHLEAAGTSSPARGRRRRVAARRGAHRSPSHRCPATTTRPSSTCCSTRSPPTAWTA